MISGNDKNNFFAAHWDWLVAGVGVVLFLASVSMLVISYGVDPETAASEEVASLGRGKAKGGVEPLEMKDYDDAMKTLLSPSTLVEHAETQGGFMSSERRVFCEQGDAASTTKACGLPISFGLKTCPYCKAKQPEEVKVVLDSDGDGIPDEQEKKWGLNPNDPADADLDKDGDGFTNIEEFLAKTDATDKLSHPDYLKSLSIQTPLKETLLPFVFERAMPTPSGMKFYFRNPRAINDMGQRGVTYQVLKDQEIGKTGFVAKSYEKKSEKRKISGANVAKEVDISVATIERGSDRKVLQLVVGDKKHVPVDIQAKLVYDRNGRKEFTVVPGSKIDLSGNFYTVTSITRDGKTAKVSLSSEQYGKGTIEALEQ